MVFVANSPVAATSEAGNPKPMENVDARDEMMILSQVVWQHSLISF
jgi:hypothetical protein